MSDADWLATSPLISAYQCPMDKSLEMLIAPSHDSSSLIAVPMSHASSASEPSPCNQHRGSAVDDWRVGIKTE